MANGLPWLTSVDADILEWLESHDAVYTPRSLYYSLERASENAVPSYSQVSRRVRTLTDAGLLERYDDTRGQYCLSDLGRRYLDDDLEAEEWEEIASFDDG